MYPLNLIKPASDRALAGFAVANDDAEHQALSDAGYEPKRVAPEPVAELDTKAEIVAALDAAGIAHDKRLGVEKLKTLLPA